MSTSPMTLGQTLAKPRSEMKTVGRTRFYFIDNLRILLTVLVILTHLAIGYGAPGDWYYNEAGGLSDFSTVFMTLLVVVNQAFFMGFFFFLSSYFSPGSLDRKATRDYLAERFKRLGIPLLFFALFISPFLQYGCQNIGARYQGSFWQFMAAEGLHSVALGPMWFVETLLLFSIIYAIGRHLLPSLKIDWQRSSNMANNGNLLVVALVMGIVTFIVRIWAPVGYWLEPVHWQLAHFPQYIVLFVLGIAAYRADWLSQLSTAQGRFWMAAVVILVVVLFPIIFIIGGGLAGDLTPFLGGLHWQSLAYAVWEQVLAMGTIVMLLVWFRDRFNRQGNTAKQLSGAAYGVYILHTPLIIILAVSLSNVEMDLGLKFISVAPLAVAICFLAGYVARRLPLAREVL